MEDNDRINCRSGAASEGSRAVSKIRILMDEEALDAVAVKTLRG